MSSATGIELGPDSCVLTAVRRGRRGVEITAMHVIEAAAWPAHDVAVAELLRSIRRTGRFPRVARVVAWGLPENANADDPMVRAALRPVVAAGFRIDAVLSPPQALTRLAALRSRPGSGGAAWLALNTFGAAIAIVGGGELLFARAFEWPFRPQPQAGARSELLQRYSLVTHLAPQVQRGIAMVQASHGITVDSAITCGDLPDLRSLTMPLIEELDVEVETLDSVEGLRGSGRAKMDRLAEYAPALRLAWAAAIAPPQRRLAAPPVRAAAALVLIAGAAWAGFTYWSPSKQTAKVRQPPSVSRSLPQAPPPNVSAQAPTPVPALPRPAVPPATEPASPSPSPAVPSVQPAPAPLPASRPATQPSSPAAQPAPSPPVVQPAPAPRVTPPTPSQSAASPPPVIVPQEQPVRRLPQQVPPASADTSGGSREQVRLSPRPAPVQGRPARPPTPLKEPLPELDSILVDGDRRLALIGGTIVGVGDAVGSRRVARIEPDFVMFREPSGLLIRVPLR